MTDLFKIPTGYPSYGGYSPGVYTDLALAWAKTQNLTGGTVGQTVKAYTEYGVTGLGLPESWKWSPGHANSTYTPAPLTPSGDGGGGGLQGGGGAGAGVPTISGCFIATAAYGTSLHRDLDVLRRFRDERLPKRIVAAYYRISPPIAKVISHHKALRWLVRQPIKVIVCLIGHS